MSQLIHTKKIENNTEIISLEWEIDESNIDDLKNIINPFLEKQDSEKLILNLDKLTFINSMVIWWFASLIWDFADRWKKFVFSEPNEEIFDIIDLVWLTAAIETYDSDEEALLSFE
jgi:anti-anti-sigma factor